MSNQLLVLYAMCGGLAFSLILVLALYLVFKHMDQTRTEHYEDYIERKRPEGLTENQKEIQRLLIERNRAIRDGLSQKCRVQTLTQKVRGGA